MNGDDVRFSRSQNMGRQGDFAEDYLPTNQTSKMAIWLIVGVVVLALAIIFVLFRDRFLGGSDGQSTQNQSNGAYQAVFLTNGQVYFGKMSGSSEEYVQLRDIFYLQVTQPPLQGSQQQGQQPTQQPQLQLVKLGNELHGPQDLMNINREHILFYEDLKNDGRVVKAITEYKANPSGSSANPNSAVQQPQAQQVQPQQNNTLPTQENSGVQPPGSGNTNPNNNR